MKIIKDFTNMSKYKLENNNLFMTINEKVVFDFKQYTEIKEEYWNDNLIRLAIVERKNKKPALELKYIPAHMNATNFKMIEFNSDKELQDFINKLA